MSVGSLNKCRICLFGIVLCDSGVTDERRLSRVPYLATVRRWQLQEVAICHYTYAGIAEQGRYCDCNATRLTVK